MSYHTLIINESQIEGFASVPVATTVFVNSRTPTPPASDSLASLVYAVVNSRIDYCNTVLAGAPRTVTDKLQRVLNAAERVVTGTRKFNTGLQGEILHDELHWLDDPDWVFLKLAMTGHRCLNGRAPPYLSGLLRPDRRC